MSLSTFIPLPYKILALAALALFLVAGGFAAGAKVTGDRWQARTAEAERKATAAAIQQANALAQKDNEIALAYESHKAATQTVYKTIERKVRDVIETPVYRNCSLDACGLCLARHAARNQPADDCPCQLDSAVRADPAGAEQPHLGRAAGSLRLGGAAVSRLPGTPESTGGIDGIPPIVKGEQP